MVALTRKNFKISIWHGEGRTLYYIILRGNIVKTVHSMESAEEYIEKRIQKYKARR